jgi:hypothetical protein
MYKGILLFPGVKKVHRDEGERLCQVEKHNEWKDRKERCKNANIYTYI